MAAAGAGYFPEDADAGLGDRLLQSSERTPSIQDRPASREKARPRPRSTSRSTSSGSSASDWENPKRPRKFMSLWVFTLIVIGVAVMFLLGVCLGFYVRELQTDKPDLKKICRAGEDEFDEAKLQDRLTGYHESLTYYIRAKGISDFVQEFGAEDPITGDARDRRLADAVLADFRKYAIGSVSVDKYDVVVTSSDPVRPNELQVLYTNGSSARRFVFENNITPTNGSSEKSGETHSAQWDSQSADWKFPHVAFSPSGVAQGGLVYGHLGRDSDLLTLRALGLEPRGSVALLRLGGGSSLADKVSGRVDNDASIWRPSIPCQTISAVQAAELMTLAFDLPPQNASQLVQAPQEWQGSRGTPFVVGVKGGNDSYVVIGAPRTSLPGQPENAVVSTSILVQLARAFDHVHSLHGWLPRRGVRLVSWGGAEFSNIGVAEMIRRQQRLMDRRMTAYFDLRNMVVGNATVEANIPASVIQLVKDIASL
ncbi:hypothetical protein EGW08_017622, partial [Elysia chlorotica]